MGNLLSCESNNATPQHSKRGKHITIPDFNGTPTDWPVWKTQVKVSLRTSNTISIIETPGEQDKPELSDDRTYAFGVLQMTCAKGTARHIINKHEMHTNAFSAWQDLCEWYEGSAEKDNNANQIRCKIDTLKLTTRTTADQHIQDFLELKADLDSLNEGYTPSTYVTKFLDNITDPDYAEDARALERNNSSLFECMKSIRRIQRKLCLDRERSRAPPNAVIPRSFAGTTPPSFPPGTSIDFSKYLTDRGFMSVPKLEYDRLGPDCKNKIRDYNKENFKKVGPSRDVKRKSSGPRTTPRNVRFRGPSPLLISDTEPEITTAGNDPSSLTFSTN